MRIARVIKWLPRTKRSKQSTSFTTEQPTLPPPKYSISAKAFLEDTIQLTSPSQQKSDGTMEAPTIMYRKLITPQPLPDNIQEIIRNVNVRDDISDLQKIFSWSDATKGAGAQVPRDGKLDDNFKIYLEQLDEIHIYGQPLRIGHIVWLAVVLQQHCKLTVLKLVSSSIGPDGMYVLQKFASEKLRGIQTLSLRDTSLGPIGMQWFSNAFESKCNIMELDLAQNSIGNVGMTALGRSLVNFPNLLNLNLSNNSITGGLTAFSSGCQKTTDKCTSLSLTNLNVSHNMLGFDGMREFTKVVANGVLQNLRKLNLRNTELTDDVLEDFSGHFQQLKKLVSLNIEQNNGITANGFYRLSETLKRNIALFDPRKLLPSLNELIIDKPSQARLSYENVYLDRDARGIPLNSRFMNVSYCYDDGMRHLKYMLTDAAGNSVKVHRIRRS